MTDLDDILYQFGIYPTLRGYHITWVAVDVGREDPEKLQMLTKWLYPAVGRPVRLQQRRRGTKSAGCGKPGLGNQSQIVLSDCPAGNHLSPNGRGLYLDALQILVGSKARSIRGTILG